MGCPRKPAELGLVSLGNTFPSYSLVSSLFLENASLKLLESLLGSEQSVAGNVNIPEASSDRV